MEVPTQLGVFRRVANRKFARICFCGILFCAPVAAQTDFSGVWLPVANEDNNGSPHIGDFTGIPMSKAARLRAESWNASLLTLPEWQCKPHGPVYIYRSISALRLSKEIDPESREITAWHAEWQRGSAEFVFYMDGRPRPSRYAPHSWTGFSTAEWVGDMLKITTTHLKEDILRRNGIPSSDQATVLHYVIRRGDYLTWVAIISDPVYLSEPMIRSAEYRVAPGSEVSAYECTPAEEIDRPAGVVPHHLPGTNEFLTEFPEQFRLPVEVTRGGKETMYPDAARKLLQELNR